jgi:hypothetical protein
MPVMPLSLGKQSNPGASPLEGAARLINCRPEIGGEEQRVLFPIRATEGQVLLGSLPGVGAGVRAMIATEGVGYAVAGRSISQFDALGSSTELGGLPSDGFVDVAVTDRDVFFCCDGLARVVRGGSVIEVTDTDAGAPISACAVANHIVTVAADGNIRASELLDATAWDELSVEKALRGPGKPLRVVNRGDSAIVFGDRSFAAWRYTGSVDGLPLQPDHFESIGSLSAAGVVSATIVRGDLVTKAIAWPATDDRGAFAGICILDGYTARKISHPAVDRDFRDCDDPTAITAAAWVSGGHGYIAWTIPGVTTWVYDTATELWHERKSYSSATWNIGQICALGGSVIGGRSDTTEFVRIDPDVHADGDDPLVVTIVTPPLQGYPHAVEINAIYLDCVTGVGLASGNDQDVDPQVAMSMSRDGATWGTERTRSLGRLGQTRARIAWHGLGTSDHRGLSFRFSASAAVVRSFMGAAVDAVRVPA